MGKFGELGSVYDPAEIESNIYEFWERNGYFKPETQEKLGLVDEGTSPYCLTLPPPNVTGQLHLGHAITIAIEDLMVRYERMKHRLTLFLPGCDHAGIATQNVVERALNKQGISRKDLGREKFIEKVWEWKHRYHARITEQSRSMGMSSDWDRERFTLDENLSRAVREAFVTLYERGLIYRGQYLVNWCPGRCESAISDLEAIPEVKKSNLWYIKYPVKTDDWQGPAGEWGSGSWAKGATTFIEVATTRPETLLGDTGVATHEAHPEYGKLIGKTAILPVLGREIPIFADPHVDPEFGTGAVKVTPAHDPNDYEMGKTHGLEFITVMDEKARMVPEYSGKYAGMDRFECRKAIVEDLEKEGLLSRIEDYEHAEPYCQRCETLVEPRVSTQWFVKTKSLAEKAMANVRSGATIIMPEREEKRFFQWMENIRDWCISRQLWWGHRIPVWYCDNEHVICSREDPSSCPECGSTALTRDEDVLDTWFSSGLWPFSTLGWPDTNSKDYKTFYPTSMRETGYDILFFWVAREMMLGAELTGETPYKKVYLHGIVRNEKGKKISKSMENVEQYDPLRIIKEFGADALRYTLISNAVPGKDINLDPRQLDAARKFCNKLWQSTRFVLKQIKEGEQVPRFTADYPRERLKVTDKWILSRLNRLVSGVTRYMEDHDYLNATRDVKNFFWSEFCDWYIEMTKSRLYDENEKDKETPKVVLLHVLDTVLRLFHPAIPYITERLWQELPGSIKEGCPALILARWPVAMESLVDEEIENDVGLVIELIKQVRSLRADFNIPAGARVPISIDAEQSILSLVESMKEEIVDLGRLDPSNIVLATGIDPPAKSGRVVLKDLMAYIPLSELIDIEAEKARLQKQLEKTSKLAEKSRKKLDGPFSQRAPPEVVQEERDKLKDYEARIEQIKNQLEMLA